MATINMETRAGVSHGVLAGYSRGCRCVSCRSAWSAYMRDYRTKHKQPGASSRRAGYYQDTTEALPVRVSPLANQIIRAKAERAGVPVRDIVERLARDAATTDETFIVTST